MEQPLKVLFVDDDLDFAKINCMGLNALGYEVHFQTSLAGIEEAIQQFSPSVIVLDVEIGKDNGIEKAREIIPRFSSIPLLFISSHIDISFITEGLAAGAVHYLKKPFDIRELDAYIQRFAKKMGDESTVRFGNYLLDLKTNQLFYNGFPVKCLTPLEKNGLFLLAENKNAPVTYDRFTGELWGESFTPDLESNIYNLISKLRKLLNRDGQVTISTIKGVGYMLVC